MTMATTIQKLAIATAGASVMAIAAHATPAEAARIFGFEASYEGYPITGSFTIDDTTPGSNPLPFLDVSYYAKAISQAKVTGYGQSAQFQDVDFYVGNDLLGLGDGIAFSQGPITNILGTNFVAVFFPDSLFSSSSLEAALDSLDEATGIALAPYLAEDISVEKILAGNLEDLPFYEVRFFEKKDNASVPEPASLMGLLGIGAWGASSAWKRRQRSQQL